MFLFELIAVVGFGLILGSFSTALIYRVPRAIPWAWERSSKKHKHAAPVYSACVSCGHKLSAFDLVPVLSWLFLRGKCRYCGAHIGARYVLTELLSVLLCLIIYVVWGLTVASFILFLTVPFLVALLVIDIDHMILPNQLVFIVGGFALIFILWKAYLASSCCWPYSSPRVWQDIVMSSLLGAVLYAFVSWFLGEIMTRLLKRDALGFGDVKFFLVAGLWLGAAYLPYFMMISGVSGILLSLLWRLKKGEEAFPFGPALVLALFFCLNLQEMGIEP